MLLRELKFYRWLIGGEWYRICEFYSFFGDEIYYWINTPPGTWQEIVEKEEHLGLIGELMSIFKKSL